MTYKDAARAWGIRYCPGGCGRSDIAHRRGFIGPFWTVHWSDRRQVYRPGLRRFAYLVARAARERATTVDPLRDWYDLWQDVLVAMRLLRDIGVRTTVREWADAAEIMQLQAERRGARMPAEMRRWVRNAVRSRNASS